MQTYFILDAFNKTVKIGKSANPEKRLKTFQTASATPLQLVLVVDGDHEKTFHRLWSRNRLSGEWFRADEALLLWIHGKRGQSIPLDMGKLTRTAISESDPDQEGSLPFESHTRTLHKAYTEYRSCALPQGIPPGLLVSEIFTTLHPFKGRRASRWVKKLAHAEILTHARKIYRESLSGLAGQSYPRLVSPTPSTLSLFPTSQDSNVQRGIAVSPTLSPTAARLVQTFCSTNIH